MNQSHTHEAYVSNNCEICGSLTKQYESKTGLHHNSYEEYVKYEAAKDGRTQKIKLDGVYMYVRKD